MVVGDVEVVEVKGELGKEVAIGSLYVLGSQ